MKAILKFESKTSEFDISMREGAESLKECVLSVDLGDPDEESALLQCIKARDAFIALGAVREDLFRPARKHGYKDKRLQDLFIQNEEAIAEFVYELERRFNEILSDNRLDDFDI
jgi:hypothetical protein